MEFEEVIEANGRSRFRFPVDVSKALKANVQISLLSGSYGGGNYKVLQSTTGLGDFYDFTTAVSLAADGVESLDVSFAKFLDVVEDTVSPVTSGSRFLVRVSLRQDSF